MCFRWSQFKRHFEFKFHENQCLVASSKNPCFFILVLSDIKVHEVTTQFFSHFFQSVYSGLCHVDVFWIIVVTIWARRGCFSINHNQMEIILIQTKFFFIVRSGHTTTTREWRSHASKHQYAYIALILS